MTGAAAPGYSSGQALDALEEVARETLPPRDRLRLVGPVVPGEESRRVAARLFALSLALRLPDSGGALRELVAALLGAAVGADCGVRRVLRAVAFAASTSTSTRRSAS